MLRPGMELVVFRESNCPLVVARDGKWFSFPSTYFTDKTLQPDPVFGGMRLRDVLGFRTGQGHDVLFLRTPRHCPKAIMERKTGDRVPILLTSPIRIAKPLYQSVLSSTKGKP